MYEAIMQRDLADNTMDMFPSVKQQAEVGEFVVMACYMEYKAVSNNAHTMIVQKVVQDLVVFYQGCIKEERACN